MRKKIVAGNWKMNTLLTDALDLACGIDSAVKTTKDIDEVGVYIAPPFTHLYAVAEKN